jgi:hypothetical protein
MSDALKLPNFIYKEEQFNSSDGRVVIRRHVVAGKEPDQWREFLGVCTVKLPTGEDAAGHVQYKPHEIIFPFFGISTHVYKNPIRCVEECMKIYADVQKKASDETVEHYKKAVREHIAKAKEIEAAAAASGKTIVVPGASTVGERHFDREGNELAAPAQGKKKSIILGG